MSEKDVRNMVLDIPKLNWPSWEPLFSASLDGIAGVLTYELSHMKRTADITFDPAQTDEDDVMAQLKKKTRCYDMRIKP